jgi:hypothetical protein
VGLAYTVIPSRELQALEVQIRFNGCCPYRCEPEEVWGGVPAAALAGG